MIIDEYTDPQNVQIILGRLNKYIPALRDFWKKFPEQTSLSRIGSFEVATAPYGLYYRVCATSVRSPIKHLQVFTYVPVSFLQLSGISGGVNRMIERVCNELRIEEFVIIQKHASPATYNGGHILCIVPADVYEGTKTMGRYVYLTYEELADLRRNFIPKSAALKFGHSID